MGYTKTNWVDRAVQNPNTYTASGAVSGTITLTPAPGTITNAGTPLNAAGLNNLESITNWAQMVKLTQDTGDLLTSTATDLNTITTTGQYYINTTQTTNMPSGMSYGLLEVFRSTSDCYQKFTSIGTATVGTHWFRVLTAGSWTPWTTTLGPVIWTTPTLNSGFAVNNSRPPMYSKQGNTVTIQGEILNKTGIIFTLPAGYRPKQYALNFSTTLATGAGAWTAVVGVGTDGTVNVLFAGSAAVADTTHGISLAGITFIAEQ